MTLQLEPMTEAEYAGWRDDSVAGYAQEFVSSGILDVEAAGERAEKDFAQLLPNGLETDNHLLWTARVQGEPVGTIWVMLAPERQPPHAFVYALDVDAAHRRRGYGQAIMEAAMQECRDRGIATMGLNVFGHNDTARRLYERLGFRVASTSMVTEL
ncbi:MAG: GNAT family N-acetyltransferase [Nocardioidaceae bacterium]